MGKKGPGVGLCSEHLVIEDILLGKHAGYPLTLDKDIIFRRVRGLAETLISVFEFPASVPVVMEVAAERQQYKTAGINWQHRVSVRAEPRLGRSTGS